MIIWGEFFPARLRVLSCGGLMVGGRSDTAAEQDDGLAYE